MDKRTRYSKEVKERSVRLVFETTEEHGSQWAAIESISMKIGCTPETLRRWVRQAEKDSGKRKGLTTDEKTRIKELEREVRELKKPTRYLERLQHISHRRSSTAHRRNDSFH